MIASAETDLPEPDSPTMATISPGMDGITHRLDRLDGAVARHELHMQVVDLEHRRQQSAGRSRRRRLS